MDFGFNAPIYNNYSCSKSNQLVAIERDTAKIIGKTYKKFKRSENIPDNITVEGYFFILDEQYDSLKIDFSTLITFKVKNLSKADIK